MNRHIWGLFFVLLANVVIAADSTKTKPSASASSPVADADANTKLFLASIAERYAVLGSWEADFRQESQSAGLGTTFINEGHFTFLKPDKFRFSLNKAPDISDFISNGVQAWFVTFRDSRASKPTVRHFADLKATQLDRYLLVLRGLDAKRPGDNAKINHAFKISSAKTKTGFSVSFEPKQESDITKLTMTFDNTKTAPESAEIEDMLGNKTTLTILNFKSIRKVDPKLFQYSVPHSSEGDK